MVPLNLFVTSLRQHQGLSTEMWKTYPIRNQGCSRKTGIDSFGPLRRLARRWTIKPDSLTFPTSPCLPPSDITSFIISQLQKDHSFSLWCGTEQRVESFPVAVLIQHPKQEINSEKDHYAETQPNWLVIHCNNLKFTKYT